MNNAPATTLLIIEGHPGTLEQLREVLPTTEITFAIATSGPEGLRLLYERRPRLVLLSLVLPGMDGWETLSHIHAFADVPVILLVNTDNEEVIASSFDAGAIDVIVKPFSAKVMLARLRATLRNWRPTLAPEASSTDRYLRIDPYRQLAYVQEVEVKLTSTERRLLFFLFNQADQICTFEEILAHVWGWEYSESKQYVHIYISRLRHKLERDPKHPHYLIAERGVGYQFRRPRLE